MSPKVKNISFLILPKQEIDSHAQEPKDEKIVKKKLRNVKDI